MRRRVIRSSNGVERGLLSVVVPVYNVERYVESAVESVINQTYEYLEVIVVNDGSTDSSGEIVDRIAARDPRVQVVHTSNGGLAAARNEGLKHCSGEFVAFFDSDDVLEPDAYGYAISSLRSTGSDFAVAPYRFLRGGKLHQPGRWIRAAHAVERRGTTLLAFPQIQANVVAWSKVYRRDFFQREIVGYPVGIAYEDQEPASLGYVRARKFDVLSRPMIRWRMRDEQTSITQQAGKVQNLIDRVEVIRRSLEILHWSGHDAAHLERVVQVLESDAFTISRVFDGDDEYWAAVVAATRALWPLVPREQLVRRISVQDRVLYHLLLAGDREAAMEFLALRGRSPHAWVFEEGADGLIHGRMPAWEIPSDAVPAWALVAADWQFDVQAWLNRWDWTEEQGVLEIRGHAYFPGLATPIESIEAELRDTRAGVQVPVALERVPHSLAGSLTQHLYLDYSDSGFVAKIDARNLEQLQLEQGRDLELQFVLIVRSAGMRVVAPFNSSGFASDDGMPAAVDLSAGCEAIARYRAGIGMTIKIAKKSRLLSVSEIAYNDDTMSVTLDRPHGLRIQALVLTKPSQRALTLQSTVSGDSIVARVPALPRGLQTNARVKAQTSDGLYSLRLYSGSDAVKGQPEFMVGGWSQPYFFAPGSVAIVDGIDVTEHQILMRFRNLRPDFTLWLQSRRAVIYGQHVDGEPGTVSFSLEQDALPGWQAQSVVPGHYSLRVSELADDGEDMPIAVRTSIDLDAQLPLRDLSASRQSVTLTRATNRQVNVKIDASSTAVRTARDQRRMIEFYEANSATLRDIVYFQCLQGDQVNDSQLAIADVIRRDFPGVEIIWGIKDYSVRVPANDGSVVVGSHDYFDILAVARVLCYNHEVPEFLQPRPGQQVVQTYHGHPFKMMGVGRWNALGFTEAQIQRGLDWREKWTMLLSPTPLATRLYREHFPVSAEIAEIGHPRNDRLVVITPDDREEVRRQLGIEAGRTAVLYAPTWRDYQATSPWASKMVTFVDPQRLAESLGEGYVVLLRGHPAHGRDGSYKQVKNAQVIDVTYHPDVNDLILAADVGVFDYSSIRFDFGVTGKPMIFFVPDKQQFFTSAPSLIPFDETAPGPQVENVDELVDAIVHIEEGRERFADDYRVFRERFAGLDDGHAAERATRAIFDRAGIGSQNSDPRGAGSTAVG
ncbi:bifunctional glycosyltransferase/CDP-glycerol:glycerophosphate glycerophosphotransferase [Agromyces terreus]|uniref:bifunctional glycosyltransferase/CDP-glycerol:glycerophosphate glycerophosphotransferase n=1 Tax=Agromyces terreus TaxID=424795 RepID=UPI0022A9FE51|nr:CDP-glycerol glycerophosphotransferase family protein [Agromyces terreus]